MNNFASQIIKKGIASILLFFLFFTIFIPSALAGTSQGVTLSTNKNVITSTNATVYGTINNPSKKTITNCGIIVTCGNKKVTEYSEKCSSSYKTKTSVPFWYEFNKELGIKLTPGTKYSYEMFAYIDGKRYSANSNFTTKSASGAQIVLDTTKNVITATNATVYATIKNPNNETITDCGIIVSCNGKQVKSYSEKCSSSYKNKSSVPIWYEFNNELGLTLTSETKYSYEIFAYIGGTKYSSTNSFSTLAKYTPQPGSKTNVPMYYGNDSVLLGQTGGCRTCSMAMVLTAIGVPNATLADVFKFNGNTVYLKDTSLFATKYGVTFETFKFSSSGTDRETELLNLLSQLPAGQQVVYINTGTAYGNHALVAFLNSNGEIRINDSGAYDNGKLDGENITLAEDFLFGNWNISERWNAITSVWVIKY